ncbi:E3 ubiquitin-protein ligase RLIM-like [Ananas comosus]|uniref:E3 ubiquitin-protein ligase RLIM-like n=1 Tax=Ananas comosus TaxID=4615 RepID=A0A6P5FBA1_ANACO|nr:E3 ubiquitin-protein ligase RLIM-like [Ananas comosus]
MGSGSSRIEPRPSSPRSSPRRRRLRLAVLLCGGGVAASAASAENSPSDSAQIETWPLEKMVIPESVPDTSSTKVVHVQAELPLKISSGKTSSNSMNDPLGSSQPTYRNHTEGGMELENTETRDSGKSLSMELMASLHSRSSGLEIISERTCNQASTSRKPGILEQSLGNTDNTFVPALEVGNTTNRDFPPVGTSSYSKLSSEGSSSHSFNSDLNSAASNSSSTLCPLGEEPTRGTNHSGADDAALRESQQPCSENILNVDMPSVSSDVLPSGSGRTSSSLERRNSRRLFWDAITRSSSRGHVDSMASLLSSEHTSNLGFYDRWLELGLDLFGDGVEDESRYSRRRRNGSSSLSWHSRSRIRQRHRPGFENTSMPTTFCATGLHPCGTCSCSSFSMAGESGTPSSISRIVMLAEALFEVLDEIHRQPVSLSLSMVSLPAPESIVNSLPAKSYKKLDAAGISDDIEQCYICLSEYEDGDQIRVLPCHHEYHMPCIDKWLKEIHRVCPLCRGDVCEGVS